MKKQVSIKHVGKCQHNSELATFGGATVPQQLSFDEAYALAQKGNKITHSYFSKEEWMAVLPNGKLLFEDGCEMTIVEFWALRRGQSGWKHGWSVFE